MSALGTTLLRVVLSAVATLLLVSLGYAQIPNAGFENWSTAGSPPVLQPDGWDTNTSPDLALVTQSASGRNGLAAQGTAIDAGIGFAVSPFMAAGTNGKGFPVNFRPEALHGFFKFSPVGGDQFYVAVTLDKGSAGVGGGFYLHLAPAGAYTEFVANITYDPFSSETPDTANIAIYLLAGGGIFPHAGSTFTVDDLSWGAVSAVGDRKSQLPDAYALLQNYPNPFNPTTNIRYELPKASFVTLTVYNLLGQEVASLVKGERGAGVYDVRFDAANLPSGIYLYRLQAGNFTEMKKLSVLK